MEFFVVVSVFAFLGILFISVKVIAESKSKVLQILGVSFGILLFIVIVMWEIIGILPAKENDICAETKRVLTFKTSEIKIGLWQYDEKSKEGLLQMPGNTLWIRDRLNVPLSSETPAQEFRQIKITKENRKDVKIEITTFQRNNHLPLFLNEVCEIKVPQKMEIYESYSDMY